MEGEGEGDSEDDGESCVAALYVPADAGSSHGSGWHGGTHDHGHRVLRTLRTCEPFRLHSIVGSCTAATPPLQHLLAPTVWSVCVPMPALAPASEPVARAWVYPSSHMVLTLLSTIVVTAVNNSNGNFPPHRYPASGAGRVGCAAPALKLS